MATNLPTETTSTLIDANKWNAVINAVNDESVQLDTVQATITNVSGNVGIGNQRLSDRLGSGVTNTTNVTTGTATAQLTDIRSRLTAVEGSTGTGIAVVTNTSDLASIPGATNGKFAWVTSVQALYRYNGAATWVPYDVYAHIYQANGANQQILAGNESPINMTAEIIDPLGFHSTASNTSRFTPAIPGRYMFTGHAAYPANGTYEILARFKKNGGGSSPDGPYSSTQVRNSGFAAISCMAHATFFLNGSGDYVELHTAHSSGSAQTLFTSATSDMCSYFTARRIGST